MPVLKDVIFKVVQHKDLTDDLLNKAIQLKDESWPYGEVSQRKWLQQNVKDCDWHCFLFLGDEPLGYCILANSKLNTQCGTYNIFGLGCVCVAKARKGQGWGSILVSLVSQLIRISKTPGMLFCRDELVRFYSDSGGWMVWDKAQDENVIFDGRPIEANVMSLGLMPCSPRSSIDRIF